MVPHHYKATIRALLEADPEVAQAVCDIPHLNPLEYLDESTRFDDTPLPYCGCFIGVYYWMIACKNGNQVNMRDHPPHKIYLLTGISMNAIQIFAGWCNTQEHDRQAVRYARTLLPEPSTYRDPVVQSLRESVGIGP